MNNRKLLPGIAVGVAALAVTAMLFSKEKSKKKAYKRQVANAKDNMSSKLNELHRKAEKEAHSSTADTSTPDAVNAAKKRANDWAEKTTQN